MSEDNENQPPLQTDAPPERRRRPRRRGRRNYSRSDYGERAGIQTAHASNPAQADNHEHDSTMRGELGGGAVSAAENTTVTAHAATTDRAAANSGAPNDRQIAEQGEDAIQNGEEREPEFGEGIIEISGKGFGFLRDAKRNFVQTPQDIFVTPEIVRRFALRDGMWIYGETRRGNRGPQLMRLLKINDDEPTKYQGLRPFEELTTINPNRRIKLETVPDRYTTRIMDLMTPLGMGQRGLIVAGRRTAGGGD